MSKSQKVAPESEEQALVSIVSPAADAGKTNGTNEQDKNKK